LRLFIDYFNKHDNKFIASNAKLNSNYIQGDYYYLTWVTRPRHSSGGYSPASHRGGPGSNSGLVMWDFVMDKSGVGAGFLRELRLPLAIYIPSASPQSSSLSTEAGTIGQEWPQCQ
jgi:hypothetical protein